MTPSQVPPQSIIFVLGMHRSGTSLTASLLDRAGIPWGDRLLPSAEDNQMGFWEQTDVVALNDLILREGNNRWDTVHSFPPDWLERCRKKGYLNQAEKILQKNFPGNDPVIGLKDPRLCRTFPLWREVAQLAGRKVFCLLVVRDPAESVHSIQRRDHLSIKSAAWLWYRYNYEALQASQDCHRLIIRFADFFSPESNVIQQIADHLPLPAEIRDNLLNPDLANRILQPDLRHHRSETLESSPLLQALQNVYKELPSQPNQAFAKIHSPLLLESIGDLQAQSDQLLQREKNLFATQHRTAPIFSIGLSYEFQTAADRSHQELHLPEEFWQSITFTLPFPHSSKGGKAHLEIKPNLALLSLPSILVEYIGPDKKRKEEKLIPPQHVETSGNIVRLSDGYSFLLSPQGKILFPLYPERKDVHTIQITLVTWISSHPETILAKIIELDQTRKNLATDNANLTKNLDQLHQHYSALEDSHQLLIEEQKAQPKIPPPPQSISDQLNDYLHQKLGGDFRLQHFPENQPVSEPDHTPPVLSPQLLNLPLGLSPEECRQAIETVLQKKAFDFAFYLEKNPDVAQSGIHPLFHYLAHGWQERRNPSPWFSVSSYLETYPEVKDRQIEPLLHYYLHSSAEDSDSNPDHPFREKNHQREDPPSAENPHLRNAEETVTTGLAPNTSVSARDSHPPAKRKILLLSGEEDTPGHVYRIKRIFDHLSALDWEGVIVGSKELTHGKTEVTDFQLLWIWRHPMDPTLAAMIARAKEHSIPVVFDIDDLMFLPEIANKKIIDGIRSRQLSEVESLKYFQRIRQTLAHADQVTAPTRSLLAHIRSYLKPAQLIPNCFSPENLITSRQAITGRPTDGKLRIGYASGSRTHQRDFQLILEPIVRILEEFPETILVIFPDTLNLDEFPRLQPFDHRIERRNMVPVDQLLPEYARFAVNLAPLEVDNPFCEAKSELKFFEAALVETPTIASPTQPFREVIQNGRNGYLAKTTEDWYQNLKHLLTDPDHRRNLGHQAKLTALWRHGPFRQKLLLRETLDSLTLPGYRKSNLSSPPTSQSDQATQIPPQTDLTTIACFRQHLESQITVVIPLRNNRQHLVRALDSIKLQTLSALDLILVNDASTDDSLAVAQQWLEENQSRFGSASLVCHPPGKQSFSTRNTGFHLAETSLVFHLDPIFSLPPDSLQKCRQQIDQSAVAITYPAIETIFDQPPALPLPDSPSGAAFFPNSHPSTALIRREAWLALGGYHHEPELPDWEDFDFWCRLVEQGFSVRQTPGTLTEHPAGEESPSGPNIHRRVLSPNLLQRLEKIHPWLKLRRENEPDC